LGESDAASTDRLVSIEGQPPDLVDLPPGCAFEPRCRFRERQCTEVRPPLVAAGDERRHACLIEISQR
jgi:oligopeptide/dipeptide ABC transporter ATP-binding protein